MTFEVSVRDSPAAVWKIIYESGTLTYASAPVALDLDITGARQLRLRVTDAGDDHFGDVAVWAGACVD